MAGKGELYEEMPLLFVYEGNSEWDEIFATQCDFLL
jgi:hypothetical protein